jgi:uncharacterized protein YceH (UPF0502 family)
MELGASEIRVLGSLMEKARTTPEVYPLTLNSLVHACNQKTSREPVTDYDDEDVMEALDTLRDKQLVMRVDMAGSRTAKFRENATGKWLLEREEYALLATLLLRGPQTPGQLRQRADRIFSFATIDQVVDCLKKMQQRAEEPHCLVQTLPRRAGTKEIRYAHTLCPLEAESLDDAGLEALSEPSQAISAPIESGSSLEKRVKALEDRLAEMESILNELTS